MYKRQVNKYLINNVSITRIFIVLLAFTLKGLILATLKIVILINLNLSFYLCEAVTTPDPSPKPNYTYATAHSFQAQIQINSVLLNSISYRAYIQFPSFVIILTWSSLVRPLTGRKRYSFVD